MSEKFKNGIEHIKNYGRSWHRKAFETLILVICLALVLTTLSYSWIKRKWTPSISETNMQIMAGESLVFSLIGNGNEEYGNQNSLSLNSVLGLEDFTFRPVSNFSGNSYDFFNLNTTDMYHEYFTHLMQPEVITDEGWTLLGKQKGYIEISFTLQGKDIVGMNGVNAYTKYVYLSLDSGITYSPDSDSTVQQKNATAANAFRVSITVGNDTAGTYIFVPSSSIVHKAINNATTAVAVSGKWAVDGTYYRADPGENGAVTQSGILRRMLINSSGSLTDQSNQVVLTNSSSNVSTFQDYMGGYSLVNGEKTGSFNSSAVLFTMNPGDTRKITVRIWLEGEDENCTSDIKGAHIDFMLGFESYNFVTDSGTVTTAEETTAAESTDDSGGGWF